jgi:hypothetical protein
MNSLMSEMPGPLVGVNARAGPRGADDDTRRGKLVLGLHHADAVLLRVRVAPVAVAVALERVHERRRGRDRIPRAHRRARVDAAERGGGVAVDHDELVGEVHLLEADRQRTREVLERVRPSHVYGLEVGIHQRLLRGVLLLQQSADDVDVHAEQRAQRADVGDVLHEQALARSLERLVAHARERDAEERDVVAGERAVERPGRVVEQEAAGLKLGDIALVRGRVHRHDQIEDRRPRRIAAVVDPDLVPRRQSLDVRREHVLPRHRDAHAEDRLPEQAVGTGGARAVDRRHLEGEVVDAVYAGVAEHASA